MIIPFSRKGSDMEIIAATNHPPAASRPSAVAGVAAGVTGGTGLLALVNSIPDTNHWKPLLTLASPTVAVVISALWGFLMSRVQNWVSEKTLDSELKKAEAACDKVESDERSSQKAKEDARAKMEFLRSMKLMYHSKRVEAIIHG